MIPDLRAYADAKQPRIEVVDFDRFAITCTPNPRIVREDGCDVIFPDDVTLPLDIWRAMPRPRDEVMTIVTAPLAERTTGGVMVDRQMRETAASVSYIGLVLAMGVGCYRREKWMILVDNEDGTWKRKLPPPACRIGDTVIFGRQSALVLPVHASNATSSKETVDFRFLHSQAVNGIAPYPEQMQQCAAFGL